MESERILRSEAGVLADDQLTPEQRQAGKQVFDLVREMLQSSETVDTPKPHYLPRIDARRSNRVLLLDGGRGSGKTALLVTLFERWRTAHIEIDTSVREKRAESGFAANPNGRIVPFGLLDLHPLPPSTNLLFHVIGRFEQIVEWVEGPADDMKQKIRRWRQRM